MEEVKYIVVYFQKWEDLIPAPNPFPFPVTVEGQGSGYCPVFDTKEELDEYLNGFTGNKPPVLQLTITSKEGIESNDTEKDNQRRSDRS
jgi:hypothetical protein